MSTCNHIGNASINHNACDVDNSLAQAYEQSVDPDPIYKEIGAIIRGRRKALEMTQEALSAKLGISRGSLANIETGRQNILVHHLYAYASALGLSTYDLLPASRQEVQSFELKSLPIPSNLNRNQAEQIARLLHNPDADKNIRGR